jgi:hypothetical protein
MVRIFSIAFLSLALIGCDDSHPDSARGGSPSDRNVLSVSGPVLEIGGGGLQESESHSFMLVDSGILIEDTMIVVLDSRQMQVRAFDRNGTLIWRTGRLGQGPGEWEAPAGIARSGEGLVVFDREAGKITRLSLAGDILGEIRVAPPPLTGVHLFQYRLAGVGGSGEMVLVPFMIPPAPRDGENVSEVALAVLVFDAEGSFLKFARNQAKYQVVSSGGSMGVGPFSYFTHVDVVGSRLVFAHGDAAEVTLEPLSRGRETALTWDWAIRRPTDEDLEAMIAHRIKNMGVSSSSPQAETLRGYFSGSTLPEFFPATANVRGGPSGFIWIQDYPIPWEQDSVRWNILSSEGNGEFTLSLPVDADILDVGEEVVLLHRTDEWEAPVLELWEYGEGKG